MPIEFNCSSCSTTLRVPDEHLGKQARCPKCQTLNLVQPSTGIPASPQSDSESLGAAPQPVKPSANPYAVGQRSVLPPGSMAGHAYQTAHRGGVVLTLGILSLACNVMLIPGILAWILGHADLKQMNAGKMDPEGRGLTQAGMVLGIIGTLMAGLALLFYFGMIVFVIFAGAAGANAGCRLSPATARYASKSRMSVRFNVFKRPFGIGDVLETISSSMELRSIVTR